MEANPSRAANLSATNSSESKRLRILFTEGSSLSACQTLYALKGRHEIDIIDPTRLCLCRFSRYVRRWYRCPSFSKTPEAYLDFVIRQLEKRKYDVLIPTHEQVYLVARFQDRLCKYVNFAVPNFKAIEETQSKIGFIRLMQELRLPHPATIFLKKYTELDREWDYPCFLKLAHGTAGNGVRLVRNKQEMLAAAEAFRRQGGLDDRNEYMVQQPAVGRQCTVQAVYQHGRLVGAHCSASLIVGQGGGNLAREGVSHPQVVEHMATFGRHMNWHGPLFVEYFYDEATDRPEYYECNPRIGETLNASLSGVDLAGALVRISMGETIERLPDTQPGVRSHEGFMVLMDKGLRGASRKDLLAAMSAIRRKSGVFAGSQDELTRPGEDPLSVLPAIWITTRLLARPVTARKIVRQTVDNYSLPEAGADLIRDLHRADMSGTEASAEKAENNVVRSV